MPFSAFNSALLWGAGLVSVPIVIHLLNRQRYRVIDWAAMEWLLRALKQNRRRILLEQLLLLALRCLIILLIVLAVSKIYFSGAAGLIGDLAGARTDWVVVLDDSFTMGQTVGAASCFERAKEEVSGLLDQIIESKGSHSFALLTPRAGGRALPQTARVDRDFARRLENTLAELEPSDLAHSSGTLLERGLQAFEDSEADNRKLVVISDCRVRGWRLEDAAMQSRLQAIDENIEVHVLDVGPTAMDQTANLSVKIDLREASSVFVPDMTAELVAIVHNYGDEVARNVELDCIIQAPDRPEPTVRPTHVFPEIPPGDSAEHVFFPQFAREGVYAVTFKLGRHPQDTLAADNIHHVAIDVQKGLRLLLIHGEIPEGRRRASTHHLRLAVETGRTEMGIVPIVEQARLVRPQAIENADVIVLADVDDLDDEQMAALRRFLRRGGGLAIFPGEQVEPDRFNTLFGEQDDASAIAPAPIEPPVGTLEGRGTTEAQFVRLDLTEFTHPLIESFEEVKVLFQDVRFYKHFPVMVPMDHEDHGVRIVASYNDVDQSPAILERRLYETRTVQRGDEQVETEVETGRVIMVTTTADDSWTNWPTRMSYPIFMPILVNYLYTERASRRNVHAGSPLRHRLDTMRYKPSPIEVILPETAQEQGFGAQRTLQAVTDPETGAGYIALGEEITRSAGIYRVTLQTVEDADDAPDSEVTEFFAANVDHDRSDLRRHEPDALQRNLAAAGVNYAGSITDIWRIADESRAGLWRYVLVLLGCTLALESFLGWKFGHHKR